MMIIDKVPFYVHEIEVLSPLGGYENWLMKELHLAYDNGRLLVWNTVGGVEVPIHLLDDVETGKMLKRLPEFLKFVHKHIHE
jgi:hypothetical protein